jgi:hypothetical protein
VIQENGMDAKVEKLTTLNDFHKFGIRMTPGLVVNGKILSQGKIPTRSTLISWLFTALAEDETT